MIEFSSRVWEPTGTKTIDGKEVTTWSSHEPSDEDKLRRKLLKHESEKRLHEIRVRNEEWSKEQREQELRRRG